MEVSKLWRVLLLPLPVALCGSQFFSGGGTEDSCWDSSEGKDFFPFFFSQHFQMLLDTQRVKGKAGISEGWCDCGADELLLGHGGGGSAGLAGSAAAAEVEVSSKVCLSSC